MRDIGLVKRKEQVGNNLKILVGKILEKLLGVERRRWEDNIKIDIKERSSVWIELIWVKMWAHCQAVVNKITDFRILKSGDNFV
jgi:hypothetical protein